MEINIFYVELIIVAFILVSIFHFEIINVLFGYLIIFIIGLVSALYERIKNKRSDKNE